MKERIIDIPTRAGSMPTFVTHPAGDGPYPPVVIYMDVWGVREELYDVARRVATVGYYCMVPDLYYRQGAVRHAYRDADNRMISMEKLDETRKETVRTSMRALTDAMVVEDSAALLEFIDREEPVRPGGVGAIGYCMGGRHVFRVAGELPERFTAVASLHGTRLVTDQPDSPHHTAEKARGEIYCGFAEHDPYAPLSTVNLLAQALPAAGVRYHHELHKGAEHGYALPDRDIFDKQAANRDWELIFAMFHRRLPPSFGA